MTFLRSLAFNLFFFASGAVILTAALPVLVLPRRFSAEAGYVWFGLTLWALRTICGITYEVRGREKQVERKRANTTNTWQPGCVAV